MLMMEMGGLVERQVHAAVGAFVSHDAASAAEILVNEKEVNRLEMVIDDQCVRTIALRQPAARDLRFLVSIMKAGTDLERAGDETVRIARMADKVSLLAPPADGYADVLRMGELSARMLRDALDAFARTSVEAAYALMAADAEVDQLFERVEGGLSGLAEGPAEEVERMVASAWTARSLERIGDHAKNIGEHLIYLIEGTDVRHASSK